MEDLSKVMKDAETDENSFSESDEKVEEQAGSAEPAEEQAPGLEEALEQCQLACKQAEDRYLRSVAELDNFRKRNARETEEFRKYANMALVQKLLPSLDNMERAMGSAEKDSGEALPIVEGLRLVLADIMKTFSEFHIRPVEAEGKAFDPQVHMAVAQEEADDAVPGTVLRVYQKGYLMHDRLIRPAMVSVARAKTVPQENENRDQD